MTSVILAAVIFYTMRNEHHETLDAFRGQLNTLRGQLPALRAAVAAVSTAFPKRRRHPLS
jgi:hypothetical protein